MAEWEASQALWMWIASMGQAFRRLEPPSAEKKVSSSIVFFDFDLTLTVVHVFKSLAGWVDAQVCMLAMRGIVVSEPHALTERGQLRRLAELGPAWIEQAFGGFSRVAAIRRLLDGLLSSGCRIILVTRGYVGVARKCLAEVGFLTAGSCSGFSCVLKRDAGGLLDCFEALYGNIGVAYGARTAYDQETEASGSGASEEVDRLWSLLGRWREGEWDSKTEIVHRYKHMHNLSGEQVLGSCPRVWSCMPSEHHITSGDRGSGSEVLFVDDDVQELTPLRHSALTVHAKGRSGMAACDMLEVAHLLDLGSTRWAQSCYEFWQALRDPLASKPFAITVFNRKHLPIRFSRHIQMLEAEFAERKSSLRRFTLLMREPHLFLSIAQDAYVNQVSLTGKTHVTSFAPLIQGMREQLGVGCLLEGSFGDLERLTSPFGPGDVDDSSTLAQDPAFEAVSVTGNHLYQEPASKPLPEEPVKTLTSLVRMFQQTLLGLCPITLATAGRHRNTICCHEVEGLPEDAVWCRYPKIKHIGAGHFGEVFQARELSSGRQVAVKHLERLDPEEEEGAGDEVSVLRALAHPNLLRVFEVVKFPREVLIVTELAPGGTLSTYAAERDGGPWIAGDVF